MNIESDYEEPQMMDEKPDMEVEDGEDKSGFAFIDEFLSGLSPEERDYLHSKLMPEGGMMKNDTSTE